MRTTGVVAVLFSLLLIAEAGLVSFFTFWPIRYELRRTSTLLGFLDLYSVDSNLDVWVLSLIHVLVLPLCFIRVAGHIGRHRRRYASARMAVIFICIASQVGQCSMLQGSAVTLLNSHSRVR